MTTPRKTKTPPPVTAPAVPADEAFGNVIIANRDTAIVEVQALQSQLAARNGQYERDLARLKAEHDADVKSLADQIGRQERIIAASDAAIEALHGDNVVPLRNGEAA
jgi:hypothetical protein